MADQIAQIDPNFSKSVLGVDHIGFNETVTWAINSLTHRGLVDVTTSGNALASAPLNGQAKIAVTGTAVQLTSNTLTNGVIIIAKTTNTAPIIVGGVTVTNVVNGTGNGTILEKGMAMSWAVTNTNVLYINGTAGDIISFAGS